MAKDPVTEARTSGSTSNGNGRADNSSRAAEARDAVRTATAQVGEAVETMRTSMPEVARASREMVDDAMRRIEAGSDQRVSTGVTLSLGLAIGMLLGGAPRILIALALVPVAAMGMVLMDRRTGARPVGGSRGA